MWRRIVRQACQWQCSVPVCGIFTNLRVYHVHDTSIETLSVAITSWVVGACARLVDVQEQAHFCNHVRMKIPSLIRVQHVRRAKDGYPAANERIGHRFRRLVGQWYCFDILAEVICDAQNTAISRIRDLQVIDDVHRHSLVWLASQEQLHRRAWPCLRALALLADVAGGDPPANIFGHTMPEEASLHFRCCLTPAHVSGY